MKLKRTVLSLVVGGIFLMGGEAGVSAGEAAVYPDLPPLPMVEKAMASYPAVLAAKSGVVVEKANERALRAGSYEYTARLNGQRREVRLTPQQSLNEWSVELDRPVRLPNKARLDDEIGAQGVSRAELAYGDAMHEAGRTLLKMWFDWVRADYTARQWASQVDTLKQQLSIVEKRIKAGDAPSMEMLLAQAAVSQAETSLQQARLQQQMAATDLTQRFSGIALPATLSLSAPAVLQHDQQYWQDAIMKDNHELRLAQAKVRHWQLLASRASANRVPDPTLGVHYSSERGGEERVVGLSLSIPIPGGARSAMADSAQAQVVMAQDMEAAVVAKLNADVANLYATAHAAYATWQQARKAAGSMVRNADLMSKAYSLGEANLTDVLTARRQAGETQLTADLAQINALESHYRLMLDAHKLWPLDSDDAHD